MLPIGEESVKPMKNKDKEFEWRTGRKCQFKIFLHLVFTTKYRRNVISSEMLTRMQDIFAKTLVQMRGELIEFGGEDDHVHSLVSIPPQLCISSLVGKLKGKSSYHIRREFWNDVKKKLWGKHFWSPSYCIVSCGGAPLEVVREYVENQRRPPNELEIKRSKRFTGKTRKNGKWETKISRPGLTHS
jgi:putative transposase